MPILPICVSSKNPSSDTYFLHQSIVVVIFLNNFLKILLHLTFIAHEDTVTIMPRKNGYNEFFFWSHGVF